MRITVVTSPSVTIAVVVDDKLTVQFIAGTPSPATRLNEVGMLPPFSISTDSSTSWPGVTIVTLVGIVTLAA